ncbi:ferredoxin [Paraburkholderia sp.]|uniref:ferredoxin n=1 Tax=Paraburkholderia sp. TaxID=1926495 RepID=UPI0039E55B95
MAIKISLDLDVCQGHGLCVIAAPRAFRIDEATGLAQLLPDAQQDASFDELNEAARMCPVSAITVSRS